RTKQHRKNRALQPDGAGQFVAAVGGGDIFRRENGDKRGGVIHSFLKRLKPVIPRLDVQPIHPQVDSSIFQIGSQSNSKIHLQATVAEKNVTRRVHLISPIKVLLLKPDLVMLTVRGTFKALYKHRNNTKIKSYLVSIHYDTSILHKSWCYNNATCYS